MKRRFNEFYKINDYIEQIDAAYEEGSLYQDDIESIQKSLDRLAEAHEENQDIGTDRYLLYQLQAMLHIAQNEQELADGFLEDAENLKGDDEFESTIINDYLAGEINFRDAEDDAEEEDGDSVQDPAITKDKKVIKSMQSIKTAGAWAGGMAILSPFLAILYSLANEGGNNADVFIGSLLFAGYLGFSSWRLHNLIGGKSLLAFLIINIFVSLLLIGGIIPLIMLITSIIAIARFKTYSNWLESHHEDNTSDAPS